MTEPADLFGEDQADDLVTLTCDVDGCGKPITGKATGANSALFKLGRHRWNAHKIKGEKSGRRKTITEPTDEDHEARPIVSAVQSMAAAAGKRKGAPSAGDIAAGLGRGAAIGSLVWASYMAETDPRLDPGPAGDQDRQLLQAELALPLRAATDVMAPIGRMLAPTKLNARYGRTVIDNVDVLASFGELGRYLMTVRRYMIDRRYAAGGGYPAQLASVTPLEPQPQPPMTPAPAAAPTPPAAVPRQQTLADGVTPVPPVFDGTVTSPPPQRGEVIDATKVTQLRMVAEAQAAAAQQRRR